MYQPSSNSKTLKDFFSVKLIKVNQPTEKIMFVNLKKSLTCAFDEECQSKIWNKYHSAAINDLNKLAFSKSKFNIRSNKLTNISIDKKECKPCLINMNKSRFANKYYESNNKVIDSNGKSRNNKIGYARSLLNVNKVNQNVLTKKPSEYTLFVGMQKRTSHNVQSSTASTTHINPKCTAKNIHNINDEKRQKLLSKYSKENLMKSVRSTDNLKDNHQNGKIDSK